MFILTYGSLLLYFIYLDGKIILFITGFCHIMCFFYKEKPLLFQCVLSKVSFCTRGPVTIQVPAAGTSPTPACGLLRKADPLGLRSSRFLPPCVSRKTIRYRKELVKSLKMVSLGFIVTLKSYNQRTVTNTILKFLPLVRVYSTRSREPHD